MTGETWRGPARAILHRRVPKSLYHVIYIRRKPINLCLLNVQNAKSFFRLGLISLSSIRATILPSPEQIALPAAEIGSSVKGKGGASTLLCSGFHTTALRSFQRLLAMGGGQGHSCMACPSATIMPPATGEVSPRLVMEALLHDGHKHRLEAWLLAAPLC